MCGGVCIEQRWKRLTDILEPSLSEQFDPSTPGYVNARLQELEQFFQESPDLLDEARNKVVVAGERYASAKARATVSAEGRSKEIREAQAFIATRDEREALQVAEAAYKYLQDRVQAYSREKDALQTRSANLRAELQLSMKGDK